MFCGMYVYMVALAIRNLHMISSLYHNVNQFRLSRRSKALAPNLPIPLR